MAIDSFQSTTMSTIENENKRRRLVYPALKDVQPLALAGASLETRQHQRVLPKFLHNVLFSPATTVPYDDCPFNYYISLGEEAWKKEGEPENLIVLKHYETLTEFLDSRFRDFKVGIQQMTIVTGTAGIGKTMFSLYAARHYYQRGEFVVLYYEDTIWAFTKTNPGKLAKNPDARQLDPNLLLGPYEQPSGGTVWCGQTEKGEPAFDEKLRQWKRSGCAIIVRDPGGEKKLGLLKSNGRELYTVSSGQEDFFSMAGKSGIPDAVNQRTAKLWGGLDLMYAVKLGLLFSDSPNTLDLDYVMEGYRRFGGCARAVVAFAKILKKEGTAREKIQDAPLPSKTTTAIAKIADLQAMGQEEASETKAVLFHRSPVHTGYTVHFASQYLGERLMKAVKSHNCKALSLVVGALSVTTGHQDAYGVLYEEEMHKQIYVAQSDAVNKMVRLLGCHKASQKRVKHIIAKEEVSLKFSRETVVYFPGHSLENVRLESNDDILDTYFHPLTSNFPTHDSFILCPASDFFEVANSSLKKSERQVNEAMLAEKVVLVGLQMTVSGSDYAKDKPSHTMRGSHLTDHLKAITKILAESHPQVQILPDAVTIFLSPTESCRIMQFMDVLTTTNTVLSSAIPNFHGMAPQYCVTFEVPLITQLMSPADLMDL